MLCYVYSEAAVITVGFIDNTKLFCGSSQDQIQAIAPGNETAYCTISGMCKHIGYEESMLVLLLVTTLHVQESSSTTAQHKSLCG